MRRTIVVGIVVLGACAHERPVAVMDRDIYSAAIATLLPNDIGRPIIITEEAIPFPRRDESAVFDLIGSFEFDRPPAWQWKDAPAALLRAVAGQPATERTLFTAAVFPSNARVVSHAEITRTLSSPGNWNHFTEHFRATSWQAFSKVLITLDAHDAVMYYELRCGGTCGDGGYLWLHRASVSSPWVRRSRVIVWMS
jgi:hypothetical protein